MRKFIFAVMLAASVLYPILSFAASSKEPPPLTVGWAQIRPENDYVYVRARSSADKKKTPFGLFAFDRKRDKWTSIGTASSFSEPSLFGGDTISPETFFYSKQGYPELPFGNYTYIVSSDGERVVITARSGAGENVFKSDPAAINKPGRREYQFKHISGTQLWFDMRVVTDESLYSEGIGYFDAKNQTFHIFNSAEAGIRPEQTVVTRLTGAGRDVYAGVSYCGPDSCLDDGAVVFFKHGESFPTVYNKSNSPLPGGGVLDISADSGSLWIASSSGITRWSPGSPDSVTYLIAPYLVTTADVPAKSCPDCQPDSSVSVPEGERLLITGFTGDGFITGETRKIWVPAESCTLSIK